mgnify:CR=1 FL=1|tara:strand:+ start:1058 stop:1366 length:309 start_codon:yes stop_codon:yes gene_type:complete
MIKEFRKMMDDDKDIIDIDVLLSTKEDREHYNKWLSIFQSLTPFNIPTGLNKVLEENELNVADEAILLAYIKFFEQRIFEMAKSGKKEDNELKEKYDGAMFG